MYRYGFTDVDAAKQAHRELFVFFGHKSAFVSKGDADVAAIFLDVHEDDAWWLERYYHDYLL